MKYYAVEYSRGYRQIEALGLSSWRELHGEGDFEIFAARTLLQTALPTLSFSTPHRRALEYGCGTGPGACYLACNGYDVEGIDQNATAIKLARQQAGTRQLDIRFRVQDICDVTCAHPCYDLILDSYCLQSIVLDRDRQRLFEVVKSLLLPGGFYLVGTAIWHPERRYGAHLFDTGTGISHRKIEGSMHEGEESEDAVEIDGEWYLPHRRHLTPEALRRELEIAGFSVRHQDGGDLVLMVSPDS